MLSKLTIFNSEFFPCHPNSQAHARAEPSGARKICPMITPKEAYWVAKSLLMRLVKNRR